MADEAQLYVYYRVRPADAPAVIALVSSLHTGWRARWPGLACTLARRAEDRDGAEPWTLMETYVQPGGVAQACRREIERAGRERLGAWIVGERHSEVFVPCA
jgi:Domain of unknown function (DUF4936)